MLPSHAKTEAQPLEVRRAILEHLSGMLDAASISTSSTSRAVRQRLPSCPLTDEELTELVAAAAIEAGFAVAFDGFDNDNVGK